MEYMTFYEESREEAQKYFQKILSEINTIFYKLNFLKVEEFVEYINENETDKKILKSLNKIFNKGIYSCYDYTAYLVFLYFIKKLRNEKLEIIKKYSNGNFKKLINIFYEKYEYNYKLKYMINYILAEWDPIGVPYFLKFNEYKNYIGKIFRLRNNKNKLEKYFIHLIKDIIGLNYDENDKNNKDGINELVDKIIALYR
jgi:hypothetical protein